LRIERTPASDSLPWSGARRLLATPLSPSRTGRDHDTSSNCAFEEPGRARSEIPRRVAARLEGGANAPDGNSTRPLAAHEPLLPEKSGPLYRRWSATERIVLFRRDPARQEPVRVGVAPMLARPFLHGAADRSGDRSSSGLAVRHGAPQPRGRPSFGDGLLTFVVEHEGLPNPSFGARGPALVRSPSVKQTNRGWELSPHRSLRTHDRLPCFVSPRRTLKPKRASYPAPVKWVLIPSLVIEARKVKNVPDLGQISACRAKNLVIRKEMAIMASCATGPAQHHEISVRRDHRRAPHMFFTPST